MNLANTYKHTYIHTFIDSKGPTGLWHVAIVIYTSNSFKNSNHKKTILLYDVKRTINVLVSQGDIHSKFTWQNFNKNILETELWTSLFTTNSRRNKRRKKWNIKQTNKQWYGLTILTTMYNCVTITNKRKTFSLHWYWNILACSCYGLPYTIWQAVL